MFPPISKLVVVICLMVSIHQNVLSKKVMRKSNLPVELLTESFSSASHVAAPTIDSHRVSNLPGLPSDFKSSQYAGHLPVSENSKGGHLFYWLFEAEDKPEEKPIVIWLNGGPGCSSMEGLFSELGPLKINEDGKTLRSNPFGWHKAANIMFIDQPVGTGMSFKGDGNYTLSEKDVDRHFYFFLTKFFALHTKYSNFDKVKGKKITKDIYFTGESYAGRYIPNIVSHILEQNKILSNDLRIIVPGIAIGNGWTHPRIQYDYSSFGLATGLVGKTQYKELQSQYKLCLQKLDQGITFTDDCGSILDMILERASVPNGAQLNTYDIRVYLKNTTVWPVGVDRIPTFLDRLDVRKAINALRTPHKWQECSDPVYNYLVHEDGVSSIPEVKTILQNNSLNTRVLFYNGQFDLICNHLGTESFLHQMKWNGRNDFTNATRFVWSVDDIPAGYVKSTYDNSLSFIVVLGGSHMVPYNEPKNSLDMITRFIRNGSFNDFKQTYDLPYLSAKNVKLLSGPASGKVVNQKSSNVSSKFIPTYLQILWFTIGSCFFALVVVGVIKQVRRFQRRKEYNYLYGHDI